jgi:hypothetical protein
MSKPYYSEYLDTYLEYCKDLIKNEFITKEEAATKINLPSFAVVDLFEHTYNFSLTEDQINKLFEEVDKMHFQLTYSKDEQKEIIESYKILHGRKNKLSEKELSMYKDVEGKLDRAGYFQLGKKKRQNNNTSKI